MTYLVVIVGLLLLIFLHELGHFLAAKAVGIQPRKFYVGFPPALAKIRRVQALDGQDEVADLTWNDARLRVGIGPPAVGRH